MRNLKLILAYDGSEFAGWQVQPARATVQGTLASAIGRLSGENVLPQGSGRTDAGVHALAQVATFHTASPIPIENWAPALNDILPLSVRVLEASEEAADFHARKSARAKTYRYRIYRGAVCPPFLARYVWHYPYPLDETEMTAAAKFVIGEHDFTSFTTVDPERMEGATANTRDVEYEGAPRGGAQAVAVRNIRQIFSSSWIREGDEFVYSVCGSGFLHHMVRNLVGTFVLVGKGSVTVKDFERILTARDRSAAGPTAPAGGLFLINVLY
jgi:tRNA pseudouridine38-40 synthase